MIEVNVSVVAIRLPGMLKIKCNPGGPKYNKNTKRLINKAKMLNVQNLLIMAYNGLCNFLKL